MPATPQDDMQRFFVEIVQGALHGSNAAGIQKVLEANKGSGNGIEDHVLCCPICQRIQKLKVAR